MKETAKRAIRNKRCDRGVHSQESYWKEWRFSEKNEPGVSKE